MAGPVIPESVEAERAETARLSADLAANHALAAAAGDPEGRAAAAGFLTAYRRFVDLQIATFHKDREALGRMARLKRLSDILRVIAQAAFLLAGLAVVGGIGLLAWSAATSHVVIVDAFQAPAALAEDGLVGVVVAGKVLDALVKMQSATRVSVAQGKIRNAWSDQIEVRVPQAGVSLGQLSAALHRLVGHDIHLDGALVRQEDGSLTLSIRGDGIEPASFSGKAGDIDTLVRSAAEYAFGRAQPAVYAAYLMAVGRLRDCADFIQAAFPRVGDATRPVLANLWGEALLALNEPAAAAARFHLALQIDPHDWRAWNNLVAVLSLIESEMAAFRTGMAMRDAASGFAVWPKPTLFDQANFAQLTLDPGAVIAGLMADRQVAEREGGEFDDSTWIAEQEAVRHDWTAVARYLAESPSDDPTARFDGPYLAGLQALEAGDVPGAIRRLEAAMALWHAVPALQAYFPDAPCTLGLAYAQAGQTEAAMALLQDHRFVRCRAFRADALDLAGRWPEAQAAYRAAEEAAPALAFAFYREGLARLRHKDLAGARGPLEAAQQRSPHWADPLKALGDAAMAEGRPQVAAEHYRAALQWAPAWAELQAALSRAGA
jgi:tetratricopeptide (TPR) repeat protein